MTSTIMDYTRYRHCASCNALMDVLAYGNCSTCRQVAAIRSQGRTRRDNLPTIPDHLRYPPRSYLTEEEIAMGVTIGYVPGPPKGMTEEEYKRHINALVEETLREEAEAKKKRNRKILVGSLLSVAVGIIALLLIN